MKQKVNNAAWIVAACFFASCSVQNAASTNEVEKTVVAPPSAQPNATEVVNSVVPDAKTVLADIYKEDIKNAEGDQVSDGRYVSYWSGKQFSLNGRNYFVGFSEASPPSEIEYPLPEDKVSISQATYESIDGKWMLKKVQMDVGKFGGSNKPPIRETDQKEPSFSSPSGKYFLAFPSYQSAMAGIGLSSVELFAFSENDASWQYLGQIKTGSDNSAGCADEPESTSPTKCATSTATLEFAAATNEEWPMITVQRKGSAVSGDGKVFQLTSSDAQKYRYDSKSAAYIESTH